MTDVNDAGPQFQMSMRGVPLNIDAKGIVVKEPTDPEALKTFEPTHFALPVEALSQLAVYLYGLSQNPQFPVLHAPSREFLGVVVSRIRIDPNSMPRIIQPGSPVGMKR